MIHFLILKLTYQKFIFISLGESGCFSKDLDKTDLLISTTKQSKKAVNVFRKLKYGSKKKD